MTHPSRPTHSRSKPIRRAAALAAHVAQRAAPALGAAAMCCACLAHAAEIRLKSEHQSVRPLVVLGDVAEVFANEPELADSLRNVELFPAPATGEVRPVTAREIFEILELRSVNLVDCRLSGARRVLIHGPQPMPLDRRRPAEKKAAMRPDRSAESSAPPPPQAAVAAYLAETPAHEDAPSRRLAPPRKTPQLAAPPAPRVVAARPLKRGEVIQAVDLRIETVAAPTGSRSSLQDIDEAIGKELVRPVAAGQPIDSASVQAPLLVRRGDIVTVDSLAEGVRVRTSGRALQDGAKGALVDIQLLDRREAFSGRVVGRQQVQVGVASP